VSWAKDLFQTHLHANPLRVQKQLLVSPASSPSPLAEEYLSLTSRSAAQRWAEVLLQRSFPAREREESSSLDPAPPPLPLDPKLKAQFIASASEIVFRIFNPPPPLSFLRSPIPPFDKVPPLPRPPHPLPRTISRPVATWTSSLPP
jgi:hypothetical protein